jgi:hypothetical protein
VTLGDDAADVFAEPRPDAPEPAGFATAAGLLMGADTVDTTATATVPDGVAAPALVGGTSGRTGGRTADDTAPLPLTLLPLLRTVLMVAGADGPAACADTERCDDAEATEAPLTDDASPAVLALALAVDAGITAAVTGSTGIGGRAGSDAIAEACVAAAVPLRAAGTKRCSFGRWRC